VRARLGRPSFTGLWRHPEFLKLWTGQTVSLFGSQITLLALPLTAIGTLDASPTQMGLLRAASVAPFLLFGLLAGVWVDRIRRRPVLIGADLGRALVLGSIPVAALLGVLCIEQLYAVAFVTGVLTLFFDVAYQAFLPSLVRRDQLVEGNSKLQASMSVAFTGGPGLAGGLVQVFTAATAMLLDSATFLASALFLATIRTAEPLPTRGAERRRVWAEIGEGLRVVIGNPLLRAITGATATSSFFAGVAQAVYLLYATRHLRLTPELLGIVHGAIGAGAFVGALLAGWLTRRVGFGRTLICATVVAVLPWLIQPLVGGSPRFTAAVLTAAWFVGGVASPLYSINQVSLRQAITPHQLQGRVNATVRFIAWGAIPLGAVMGGVLGQAVGLRPTLMVGGMGMLLGVPWLVCSPIRALRDAPMPASETAV